MATHRPRAGENTRPFRTSGCIRTRTRSGGSRSDLGAYRPGILGSLSATLGHLLGQGRLSTGGSGATEGRLVRSQLGRVAQDGLVRVAKPCRNGYLQQPQIGRRGGQVRVGGGRRRGVDAVDGLDWQIRRRVHEELIGAVRPRVMGGDLDGRPAIENRVTGDRWTCRRFGPSTSPSPLQIHIFSTSAAMKASRSSRLLTRRATGGRHDGHIPGDRGLSLAD